MKTEVYFVCEICGHRSVDQKEIEKCESQGRHNKFKRGEAVILTVRKVGSGLNTSVKRFPARISVSKFAIRFDKKTHKIFYFLEFDKEFKKSAKDFIGKTKFMGVEHELTQAGYPEEHLIHAVTPL